MFLKDVLWIDCGVHGTEERRKRRRQNALDGVVVERLNGHLGLLPVAGFLVKVTEIERRASAGGDLLVVNDPVEGKRHVVGGEAFAIVPLHVLAKAKGPR